MIKLINEETGKESIVIKDNGDVTLSGSHVVLNESQVKEALDKAKEGEK